MIFLKIENINKKDWLKAGKLSRDVLNYGKKKIKNVSEVLELVNQMEEKLYSLDSNASFAFPINVSINDCAAHDSARYKDKREVFGLVKLDVGVEYNGAIGDNAGTIDLSDEDNSNLVNASKNALNKAKELIMSNETSIDEISKNIEREIKKHDVKPISNLMGHGLGINTVHTDPKIPNMFTGKNKSLENNSFFAVEPFASTGAGYVKEKGTAEIYSITQYKPLRSTFSRKISTFIKKNYGKKPFSKRWIINEFGKGKTNLAFKQMKNKDMIKDYPPLYDQDLVSQSEHTFGIIDGNVFCTTN